jgi:hypothetical protein
VFFAAYDVGGLHQGGPMRYAGFFIWIVRQNLFVSDDFGWLRGKLRLFEKKSCSDLATWYHFLLEIPLHLVDNKGRTLSYDPERSIEVGGFV